MVADLRKGVKDAVVYTLTLDPSEIVDLSGCRRSLAPSDFKGVSEDPGSVIRGTRIDAFVGNPEALCLRFSTAASWPAECLKRSGLIVRAP